MGDRNTGYRATKRPVRWMEADGSPSKIGTSCGTKTLYGYRNKSGSDDSGGGVVGMVDKPWAMTSGEDETGQPSTCKRGEGSVCGDAAVQGNWKRRESGVRRHARRGSRYS